MQRDPQMAEPAGLTEPLQVPGKDFHDQVGLMLKIVDTGRVVEVMQRGKVRARLVPA
jgi:hypothetical protein